MNTKRHTGPVIKMIPVLIIALLVGSDVPAQEVKLSAEPFLSPIYARQAADARTPDAWTLQLKSENAALTASLMLTLLPTATLVFAAPGLIVGPSAGYFYAGMPGRAWRGIGLRLAGVGGMIGSFGICGWDCGPGDSGYGIAWAVFAISAGVTTGSAIYDIATVKTAVRKHNSALLKLSETIAPTYFAESKVLGLELTLRF